MRGGGPSKAYRAANSGGTPIFHNAGHTDDFTAFINTLIKADGTLNKTGLRTNVQRLLAGYITSQVWI